MDKYKTLFRILCAVAEYITPMHTRFYCDEEGVRMIGAALDKRKEVVRMNLGQFCSSICPCDYTRGALSDAYFTKKKRCHFNEISCEEALIEWFKGEGE